ncbi:MAG: hypothetical protein LBD23_04305 [Oscillospiraceae bacterium]|jgi:hypothetical protein|nr:hypothetical protein [Oscillospiraceae bacterium]
MTQEETTMGIPSQGAFAADDALSRKRKEIAERLRTGQRVEVSGEGELQDPNTPNDQKGDGKTLTVPEGKLASRYYWYERDKKLLEAEKAVMRNSFPQFKLDKLADGRLYWEGQLKPLGDDDITWTLMAVYDHDHPNNSTYGGSVKVYSVDPDLGKLQRELSSSGGLPHVLRDGNGNLYMCTARRDDFQAGLVVTSASAALRWAVKWTFTVTCWLKGDIGNEIFDYTY